MPVTIPIMRDDTPIHDAVCIELDIFPDYMNQQYVLSEVETERQLQAIGAADAPE